MSDPRDWLLPLQNYRSEPFSWASAVSGTRLRWITPSPAARELFDSASRNVYVASEMTRCARDLIASYSGVSGTLN